MTSYGYDGLRCATQRSLCPVPCDRTIPLSLIGSLSPATRPLGSFPGKTSSFAEPPFPPLFFTHDEIRSHLWLAPSVLA